LALKLFKLAAFLASKNNLACVKLDENYKILGLHGSVIFEDLAAEMSRHTSASRHTG